MTADVQDRLAELWPPFGLVVTAGPLELRPIRDADIPDVVELAGAGIHPPEQMPFSFPWTDVPAAELGRACALYYWRTRADVTEAKWELQFVVRHDGELVGIQGISAVDFPVTRSTESGSWLGQRHQGRGIGTLMRQTVCAFAFDHLGAAEVTSGAWSDNPASLGVSRKVGYVANGSRRLERRGELATMHDLVLRPDRFVRHQHPLTVHGLDGVRRLLGLDA